MKLLWMVALATVAYAFLPGMFGGRLRRGFPNNPRLNSTVRLADDPNIGTDSIVQKRDHFDAKNVATWKQQFYYNLNTGTAASGVNVLYLMGEKDEVLNGKPISVTFGAPMEYASDLNAPLYALEHRFYGASTPTENMSMENLKYLSSRQVIEDIAEFIRQKNAEKGGVQKWIVIGGSYAGNLAAWSRAKHPELIAGALASSAPIEAQLDFYGYLQRVEAYIKNEEGEGAEVRCYKLISESIEEVGRLLQSDTGRAQLSEGFRIEPPLNEKMSENDMGLLYFYLLAPFMLSAQYNAPAIPEYCEIFEDEMLSPLEALQQIVDIDSSVDFDYLVGHYSNVEFSGDYSRPWLYQMCSEFGHFQSTNQGSNMFGQVLPTRFFIEFCVKLFGITPDQTQKNVEATNDYYGGRDYFAGTNVIFSHGVQDPWSFLTKNSDPKHWSVVIVEILQNEYEGAHVSDLISCDTERCSERMRQVHTLTLENMRRWINPLFPVPDKVDITDTVGQRPTLYNGNVKPALPVNGVVIRVKRSESEKSQKIDRSRWNKFTGKNRRVQRRVESRLAQVPEQDWFEQTWDHFNPNEERTFKQKFYFNYKFGSADGPNFLLIGGEGPESGSWVINDNAMKDYAKQVGANIFDLEHRYYGESKLDTTDLQFLTSAQMLYDVATFIRFQQVENNRTGPWITFGGSYPGALAAWSREWFPELIAGAVGSSGPVLAKNDFYEYLEVVEDVIKKQSQKCYDRTAAAFEQLRELTLTPVGRKSIQDKFKLSPEWTGADDETIDPLDLNSVFSDLYSVYQYAVQYNDVKWQDVAALCAPFENDAQYAEPIDALRAAQEQAYDGEDTQTGSSFDDDVTYYRDMLPYIGVNSGIYTNDQLSDVLWMWQSCNEFGFWQTTDYGEGIFGTPTPINFFVTMCERIFGTDMDQIEAKIAQTNYQYGGRLRYNTTNVVLPNGGGDPWHALSITEQGNLDASVVPILINGTSHCADMYAATADDPTELIQARAIILANIKKWVSDPKKTTAFVIPTDTTTRRTLPTTELVTKTSTSSTSTTPTSTFTPTTSSVSGAFLFASVLVVVLGLII